MDPLMSGAARDLHSIESIKGYLVGVISAAADEARPKVALSYVGGEFHKTTGTTFEKHLSALADAKYINVPVTKRKMAPFIVTYCHDAIRLERLPTGPYVVSPTPIEENPTSPPVPKGAFRSTLLFKRAVWAAFIRPLVSGKRFLNLEQIGFTDTDQQPTVGNWVEIDGRFIIGAAPGAPVDNSDVQRRIEEWATSRSVSLSSLLIPRPDPKPASPASNASSGPRRVDVLLDLIDTLPPHVLDEWTIPAAVLKHLRSSR